MATPSTRSVKTTEPVTKPVTQQATVTQPAKPAKKPVAKRAARPVAKPAAKPVAKRAAKPVVKPAAKPVAKPVTNPGKPVTQPAAVAKPVTQPAAVAKPVTQPAAVAKPLTQPAAVAKPVTQPAAVAKPVRATLPEIAAVPVRKIPDIAQKSRERLLSGVKQGQQLSVDVVEAWVKAVTALPGMTVPAIVGSPTVPDLETATRYAFDVAADVLSVQRQLAVQLSKALSGQTG